MTTRRQTSLVAASLLALTLAGCSGAAPGGNAAAADVVQRPSVNPEAWPAIAPQPLDPAVEARVDGILARMTLEQKVGQVIQADSGSVTPEDVRRYRLGSVLSGGNSAPGPLPYADAATWLEAADAYFEASLDPEGVEVAVPIIWGIDAVHGHANLRGAVVFPHNIGLGAANNPDLIEEIYRITAHELSVSGHDWTFAPTLAVPRDDRWGRTYEGFSESPEIVAEYAPRIVYGLQGRPGTDEFMAPGRVISSAKHYLADGGTEGGRDQGDARISEAELRDIHAAGYYTSIPAGVQTVMASFSSWCGEKMHGHRPLLTDVLRDRMGFNGFVVGDWNGHGAIEGCTVTDCPDALNAGLDMYMAPDSWRGLYESTLAHMQSGRISQARLDEAVRRILRVKVASGVFEAHRPSERPLAGDMTLLSAPHHREVARQAVRESLVLLKNADQILPLDPALTVLVVGDGADSIAKASGGWTLSWQGGGFDNAEFPNGQSILSGIEAAVSEAGGRVIHDPEASGTHAADVVIAVYGEDPYAEFQGDRDHLDFQPSGFDTGRLQRYADDGLPVVSVFLSGRPLWTNPEINASDAFIAAWLPGSEGGGVADLLFRTDPDYEFTGRLSFSWPARADQVLLNREDEDYAPLFAYGYGLSFADASDVGVLPEDSGLDARAGADRNVLFSEGRASGPWAAYLVDAGSAMAADTRPARLGGAVLAATDRTAQEDSLRLSWSDREAGFALLADAPQDLARQSNGAMKLSFRARAVHSTPGRVEIAMGCREDAACLGRVPLTIRSGGWDEYRVSLSCFADQGVDMGAIEIGFGVYPGGSEGEIELSDIRLAEDTTAVRECGALQP